MDAVEYSIGVNNRFKLLEEDEDQTDVVQDSEKSSKDKKEKKAKNVRSVKDAKPQQTKKEKEAVNEETRKDAQNKKGGRVAKDGVKRENEKNTKLSNGPREDRENIPPRGKGGFNRRKDNEGTPEGDSPAKDEKREDRGGTSMGGFSNRGRGRGGNVGRGRGGFGGPRGGGRKRDFDRRSGSDRSGTEESSGLPSRRSVKPQDKREGGGSFNWGNPTDPHEGEVFDEKKAEWEGPSPEAEESKPTTDEGQAEEPEESEEQSEETKEMTLEEWKELQEKYRSKMSFEVRKPGEGEKKGQWKNTHVLSKKSVGDDDRQQLYEERIKTSGRVKQKVEGIQFSFVNSESPEPRRGGRGGRGGRGRGGGRGGSRGRGRGGFGGSRDSGNAEFAINQEEFPTLG